MSSDGVAVRVDQRGVTAEIRVIWRPDATHDEVMAAVVQAVGKLVVQAQQEGLTPPDDWVAGPPL